MISTVVLYNIGIFVYLAFNIAKKDETGSFYLVGNIVHLAGPLLCTFCFIFSGATSSANIGIKYGIGEVISSVVPHDDTHKFRGLSIPGIINTYNEQRCNTLTSNKYIDSLSKSNQKLVEELNIVRAKHQQPQQQKQPPPPPKNGGGQQQPKPNAAAAGAAAASAPAAAVPVAAPVAPPPPPAAAVASATASGGPAAPAPAPAPAGAAGGGGGKKKHHWHKK
jgi:hypothetical protein